MSLIGSGETNLLLFINYVHYFPAHFKNQDGEVEDECLEDRQISIPFPIFYPVVWIKPLFDADQTTISDLCDTVIGIKIKFKPLETEETHITRKVYEQYIKEGYTNANECKRCYYATVKYCDKIYGDMLDIINNSIYELILCLKVYIKQKDLIKLIGRMAWNTRHEIVWIN